MKDISRKFKINTKTFFLLIIKLQRIAMLVSTIIVILGVVLQVITRYVFRVSIVGIEEFAAYVAIWLYFIGASYGSYERSHISAELIHLVFKNPRNYAKARAVVSIFTSIILLYALPWAYDYIVWGIIRKEISNATL